MHVGYILIYTINLRMRSKSSQSVDFSQDGVIRFKGCGKRFNQRQRIRSIMTPISGAIQNHLLP